MESSGSSRYEKPTTERNASMKKHANNRRSRAGRTKLSAAEDREITKAALADPDNPPLSDEMFAKMRPATPDLIAMARRRGERGPQKAPTKKLVSMRLDPEVLTYFRQEDPGWQVRINDALRKVAKLPTRKRA